jgi:hypothetical protein
VIRPGREKSASAISVEIRNSEIVSKDEKPWREADIIGSRPRRTGPQPAREQGL